MLTLQEAIPNLDQADESFRSEQIEAFASVEPDICGVVQVRPFTPRMFLELELQENGFFQRRAITPVDVAVFLWRISVAFKPDDANLRTAFHHAIAFMPLQETAEDILRYIARSWKAMPSWNSGKGRTSAGVWPARLVHMFGSEYGWSEEYVLDMPFRRLWQYSHRVMEENNPDYKQKNPLNQELRRQWLLKQQAEADARKAAAVVN